MNKKEFLQKLLQVYNTEGLTLEQSILLLCVDENIDVGEYYAEEFEGTKNTVELLALGLIMEAGDTLVSNKPEVNRIFGDIKLSVNVVEPLTRAEEVLAYLNKAIDAPRGFGKIDSNLKHIRARISEGYSVEDCIKVIDAKTKEWLNTDYAKFLRPETLFAPSKFQSYLIDAERVPASDTGNYSVR